ncbi:hypothetical protein GCM10029992_50860 [Glycomyces albus]
MEIYREWMNGALRLERRTVHLADDCGRFVQIDTKTADPGGIDDAPLGEPVARYQYGNHIGSATLETDEDGQAISYEEYHPYGSTAYRSSRPGTDHSLKRYRFHGKERDDETGLHYFGARYYAAWLGRWISPDPIGNAGGANLYRYCSNDPVGHIDPNGAQDRPPEIPEDTAQTGVPGADPDILGSSESDPADVLREAQRAFPWLRATPVWNPESGTWFFPDLVIDDSGNAVDPGAGGGEEVIDVVATPPGDEGPGGGDDGGGADEGTDEGGGGGGEGPGPGAGGHGVAQAGREASHRGPGGPTLEVPDNFDDVKIAAYTERIQTDRGVGLRSADPSHTGRGSARTDDIRDRFEHLADDFDDANGNRRSKSLNVDHTVELQHVRRQRGEFVRRQDHRYWPESINKSQGTSAMHTDRRARAAGAVEDVPAGGVARTGDMGHWRNSPRYRTGLRWGGRGLFAGGTALGYWGPRRSRTTPSETARTRPRPSRPEPPSPRAPPASRCPDPTSATRRVSRRSGAAPESSRASPRESDRPSSPATWRTRTTSAATGPRSASTRPRPSAASLS